MNVFKITGKVFYKNIGIGTWGIRDLSGKEYRPNFMPEQLKTEGARVSVTAKKASEGFSMHMWGEAIDIIGFHTLNQLKNLHQLFNIQPIKFKCFNSDIRFR